MARGKVYLVGAGPGDPELMTLKAKRLLGEADVVLFDRLLDPRMLEGVKAELIDVGKNAGRHKLTQEGINQLLIEKAETWSRRGAPEGRRSLPLWPGRRGGAGLAGKGHTF